MADELYRSHDETKVSSKQREPYYIHTHHGREVVKPSRTSVFKAPSTSSKAPANQSSEHTRPQDDSSSTLSAPLINPRHPPEICPPSSSRWQRLKEENEQRKSREVTRVSYDEAARISGRDQRGFKQGEEEGWTERQKDMEAKRARECRVM